MSDRARVQAAALRNHVRTLRDSPKNKKQKNTKILLRIYIYKYMKGPKQKGRISLENLEVGFFSGSERTK